MTPEQTRQVEQLARQLCEEAGYNPEGILPSRRMIWQVYEEEAAEQLGFVREEG